MFIIDIIYIDIEFNINIEYLLIFFCVLIRFSFYLWFINKSFVLFVIWEIKL